METIVSGRHLDITDAIRKYATDKLNKLPRYYDRITVIEAVLSKNDRSHEVEVIVQAERTDPFVCKINGNDLYACIDDAVDKLERQLTDHKERLRNRKHPA